MAPTGPLMAAPDLQPPRPNVRARLAAQRVRDTKPELAVRRELHARGLRYRVDAPILLGSRRRADILFSKRKVAVFIDGCFWHRCEEHCTIPKSNHDWWAGKLAGNVARDRDTDLRLEAAGWTSVRVWEHEPVRSAMSRILSAVQPT